MPPSRLTWAALFTMVASSSGCSGAFGGSCDTDQLPPDDPCFMRECCETVTVVPRPDGGFDPVPEGVDGGPTAQQRFCGACNG
ncbi:MAG: hypothetical protein M3Y87_33580 [Myxococcota bacterium]|nr:hypothetical protein [Myxococcota bacterium]